MDREWLLYSGLAPRDSIHTQLGFHLVLTKACDALTTVFRMG